MFDQTRIFYCTKYHTFCDYVYPHQSSIALSRRLRNTRRRIKAVVDRWGSHILCYHVFSISFFSSIIRDPESQFNRPKAIPSLCLPNQPPKVKVAYQVQVPVVSAILHLCRFLALLVGPASKSRDRIPGIHTIQGIRTYISSMYKA